MKPDIYLGRSHNGVFLLPLIAIDWSCGWHSLRITIGWLAWIVEIEWPIE